MNQLDRAVGSTVEVVRRVRYVFHSQVDDDHGPLELTFSSGQILLFEPASDGSSLLVSDGKWTDGFEYPLSSENETWANEHGKWEVFDVSQEDDFSAFIGMPMRSYKIVLWTMASGVYKVVLEFPSPLSIWVGIDDLRVSFQADDAE